MINNNSSSNKKTLITLLLALILISAATLRLYNLNWDLGTFPHPDERSTLLFYAPTIHFPEDRADLLDPQKSPLNPFWNVNSQERRSYTYGHFPLYLLVLSSHLLVWLAPKLAAIGLMPEIVEFFSQATTGTGYAMVGRALVGLFDTWSVYLVFLISRRLYNNWAALLAAALSAFAVTHIQLAHFFAVDPVSTTFVLLTIYGSILMVQRRTVGAAVLTGVAIGLAVSSKYSALPIVLAPAIASWFIWQPSAEVNTQFEDDTSKKAKPTGFGTAFNLLLTTAIVSFIIFAVTSPFVLLDYDNFDQAVVEEQGNMVSGVADFPFTRQYRNTTAYLYFIEQQVKWGLGWPLGLLAFAGLAWALIGAIRGTLHFGIWIILAWLVPYFGLTGLFLAKFMRYMSPITPLVIILGVGLLMALRTKLPQLLVWGLGGVTLLITMGWALMFVNGVYATEHSWVIASRWIYKTVPNGSCIAKEHWEEGVPRSWNEPNMSPHSHGYRQPELPMYDNDDERKFNIIRDTLSNCDYLVIASNRMLYTLPRLIERYPMSTKYYKALFAGDLGYELVNQFETPPKLGSFQIDDQSADESFTVYDHPRAYIFKKTRTLTPNEWFDVLGNSWQGADFHYIGEPTLMMKLREPDRNYSNQSTSPDEEKLTTLKTPLSEWPVVTDWQWNTMANNSPTLAIISWWLAVQLIGFVTFPITFLLLKKLTDGGYLLSKSFGLLLVSYGVWLLSSLGFAANRLAVIIAMLILLFIISLMLVRLYPQNWQSWFKARWPALIVGELVFTLIFLLFVNFRMTNPDLWQPWEGGEKMLEIGFLSAIVRSPFMPPFDPFFAGTYINYYYYGLFITGILIKLTGITPTIAFNLAIPMLAALTAVNVFSLGSSLALIGRKNYGEVDNTADNQSDNETEANVDNTVNDEFKHESKKLLWSKIVVGLLAVLIVIFFSNLDGMGQLLRNLSELSDSTFESAIPGLETLVHGVDGLIKAVTDKVEIRGYNYWDPSRVIPTTINEFPYWSFLFADLHPHMIGIPFTILFLGLIYVWLAPDRRPPTADRRLLANANLANANLANADLENETLKSEMIVNVVVDKQEKDKGDGVENQEDHVDQEDDLENDAEKAIETEETLSPANPDLAESTFLTELKTLATEEWATLQTQLSIATIFRWLAFPFVLGALAVINTWDLPTYLGLMVAAFAISRYRSNFYPLNMPKAVMLLFEVAVFGLVSLAAVMLLYRPFFANYQTLDVGLGLIKDKIPLDLFLKLWGFFFLIIFSWLWVNLHRPQTRFAPLRALSLFIRRWNVAPHLSQIYKALIPSSELSYTNTLLLVGASLAVTLVLALLKLYSFALLLPWLVIALLLLLRPNSPPQQAFIELLVFTGLLLLFGVQIVFLRDFLGGGDYYRMNTYFKFFIQVWVLFGLAVAVMLPSLWSKAMRWPIWGQMLWQATVLLLIFSSLVYAVLGTPVRLDTRFPGERPPEKSLDGMDYMTVGKFSWDNVTYDLSQDYEAIKWLIENVHGTPIIAEAKIGYYREGGMRVAAYTGLPSILGGLHQSEQHFPAELGRRDGKVNQFWQSNDDFQTRVLINELDISYIYIGQIERNLYGEAAIQKFNRLVQQGVLEVVFENEQTTIYKTMNSE